MLFCMLFPSLRGGKVLLMVYSQGCWCLLKAWTTSRRPRS
jgi:hypothetical protein